ncbi:MAG: glycosyltransferase family 39 protein [Candidatus Kapaibacteriota bacterium]
MRFDSLISRLARKPLLSLFLLTFIVNLPAVFFARGYGMHDDHFGPIEQPWAIINDPKIWETRTTPHAHSIFYPLLHYILFKLLYSYRISDPQDVMLVVRLLHSLFSTITIIYLYKILCFYFDKELSFRVSLFVPFVWFMPFLSVRNLIEMVCIPPLSIGYYYLLRGGNEFKSSLFSAFFFALAFALRYQTLIIIGTIIIILFLQRRYPYALRLSFFFIAFALLLQGSVDVFAWGYPFASFIEYVRYNLSHSGDYTTGPFYRFFLLLFGIFIPPLSIFIMYFFVKDLKQRVLLVVPILMFFIFHSIFPNKQERFILPIVPFVFTLGLANFFSHISKGLIFKNKQTFYKTVMSIFWLINLPLWILFSFNYGKKTRCEALYFLSKQKDVRGVYQITGELGPFKPPEFYLNRYGTPILEVKNLDSIQNQKSNKNDFNYAIIYGDKESDSLKTLTERILSRRLFLVQRIEPSLADWILYKLNPRFNKNQTANIYRIK